MPVLFGVLWPLQRLNTGLLAAGRVIAVTLLALMVCFILGQVFFRYVLNDAPRWTEEAARFGMLWMTGLMAPVAYRQGGFVAIDMVERALPRIAAGILTLVLLSLSLCLLCIMWNRGLNNHVVSLSGRGTMPSMRLPLDWFGGESIKFKNQWMFASLFVGVTLLILVNIELILRQIITLLGGAARLTPLGDQTVMAE